MEIEYRIREIDILDGSKPTYYIQKLNKILIFNCWSNLYEKTKDGNNEYPVWFETYEEALDKLNDLKSK